MTGQKPLVLVEGVIARLNALNDAIRRAAQKGLSAEAAAEYDRILTRYAAAYGLVRSEAEAQK